MAAKRRHALLRHLHQLAHEAASDRALLERFAEHQDQAAFRDLVQRHGALVLGVGRRVLGDHHAAEDVFQATFLVLARQAACRRWRASVGPWLAAVAYRLAVKLRADRHRRQCHERRAATPLQMAADDAVERRELAAIVDEEVQRLPERYRAPVVLCYLGGKTGSEAARELGWSLATTKCRLARARDLLRRRLARRGWELPVVATPVVPLLLASATVRAATLVALGEAAAGLPAPVLGLTEGILKAMTVAKWKAATTLVLTLALVAAGAGLLAFVPTPANQHVANGEAAPTLASVTVHQPPPKGDNRVRTDRYGDPLPEGALERLGTRRFRQSFCIKALVSPNGQTVAAAGNLRLALWDKATGKELRQFFDKPTDIVTFALSPDGKKLAVLVARSFPIVFEVATGKTLQEFRGLQGRVCTLAFSPRGQSLAFGDADGLVSLWDVKTGRHLVQFPGKKQEITALAFSADGRIWTGGGRDLEVRLLDPATGKEVRRLTNLAQDVDAVVFSPDARTMAAWEAWEEAKPVRLWDLASGKEIQGIPRTKQLVSTVAFSPDGRTLAAGYADGTLGLWDMATTKEIRHWRAHSRYASVSFSPDGKTLVSTFHWESAFRLWDVATGKEVLPLGGHRATIDWLRFTADGKTLFSGGREQVICRWDLATGRERPWFEWPADPHIRFLPSPDGKMVATWGAEALPLQLWDTATGKARSLEVTIKDPTGRGATRNRLTFSPDGRLLAAAAGDHQVQLWDMASGEKRATLPDFAGDYPTLAFSPDGQKLAGAVCKSRENSTMHLWEVATGKKLYAAPATEFADSLCFSPDGCLLACSGPHGAVYLWDVARGKERFALREFQAGAYQTVFSPDGRLLAATGQDNVVHLWEVVTGRPVRQFRGHSGAYTVCFAPDGRSLATGGSDSTILLWDVTGRMRDGRLAKTHLTPQELENRWTELGNDDSARAFASSWALVAAADQAVPLLSRRLQPALPVDGRLVRRLLADLDSPNFQARRDASRQLEQLGELVERPLRQALAGRPALEVRKSVEQLLEKIEKGIPSPERLRELRAIGVLEHIGNRGARALLEKLAQGAADARTTGEARTALQRLPR